jgi:hypothetical protein
MSDPQIGWTGLTPDELAARIRAHPFADVREPLMQKITLAALARALPLTPVRTGTLRRSETNRVETGGLKGWIGSNVIYAPFVHANVPFLQMGIDQSAPERDRLLQAAGDEYLRQLT